MMSTRTKTNPGFHAAEDVGHGSSVAAWVSVAILCLGSALLCWALVDSSRQFAIIGGVVCLVGVAAALILPRMGMGASTFHDEH